MRLLGNVNFEVETEGGVTQRHADQVIKRPILVHEEGVTDMDNTTGGLVIRSIMETSKGARVLELVKRKMSWNQ